MLKLLVSPASPFARKARVLIREAGRTAEVEEVQVSTSALATDASILPHNPTGRIPVLIRDDGPAVIDSRVICRFLDARFGSNLYPEARIWEVLTLEALADGLLDSALSMAYETRLRPEEKRFPDWMDAQWGKVSQGLDAIEDRWMAHLAGPIDMGHLGLACALGYLDFRHGPRNWRDGRPKLTAWDERMAARPSLSATKPA
ncbi:glutathione S-transferase family protein [Rubellimicrobium arenae]|uniref:glutathione S-transferase family protein n=1 Tax=Rubellimicrobium arenae TaxID=2817372 RepID=UPI001B30A594|nr:glutathione S-transferase family protein [Rubellimicrobium arenae]